MMQDFRLARGDDICARSKSCLQTRQKLANPYAKDCSWHVERFLEFSEIKTQTKRKHFASIVQN
jgi:hypothetical protein